MPQCRPGFGPSQGRYGKTRLSTSSVSRTFFAFAYGPKYQTPRPVPLAREHDPRVLVLDGDGDVRERLVVAQPHVERRPVPLDEVLLEVQRLDLAAGHDHLDVGDALGQLPDLRRARRVVFWKYERTRERSDFALPT